MFKNSFNKKKAAKAPQEVIFKNTSCDVPRRVASQSGERDVTSWDEVEEAIRDMLADPEEFVILTVGDPRFGIRFIQSTQLKTGGITLELALETPQGTRLVEKDCTQQECLEIFREFYNTTSVQGVEQYTPVEFT